LVSLDEQVLVPLLFYNVAGILEIRGYFILQSMTTAKVVVYSLCQALMIGNFYPVSML
jgi:hypothetical protein